MAMCAKVCGQPAPLFLREAAGMPYPQGDVSSPCEHSLHAAGRAWGTLREGIPIALWGQHAVMGPSKANDSRAMG